MLLFVQVLGEQLVVCKSTSFSADRSYSIKSQPEQTRLASSLQTQLITSTIDGSGESDSGVVPDGYRDFFLSDREFTVFFQGQGIGRFDIDDYGNGALCGGGRDFLRDAVVYGTVQVVGMRDGHDFAGDVLAFIILRLPFGIQEKNL